MPVLQWRNLVDIAIVALLLWAAIAGLRRARARLALVGFLVVGAVWLIAVWAELRLTRAVLEALALALVVVFVVVFQDDLRRLFELGALALRRGGDGFTASAGTLGLIERTCSRLSRERVGALIVLAGEEPLEPHLEGGVELDGRLSEPLLLSLFDPHSSGHDGAVLIADDRVSRFALHLPLAAAHHLRGEGGTRHAAALGLAQRSDAACVVVSEERGTISVAREGRLHELGTGERGAEELRRRLGERFAEALPRRRLVRRLVRHSPEALLSVVLAVALWFLFVPGSLTARQTRSAHVIVSDVPAGWELVSVRPADIEAVLTGTRRSFLALPKDLEARVLAPRAEFLAQGRRSIPVQAQDVVCPDGIEVESVSPRSVRLEVRKAATTGPRPSSSNGTP